MSTLRGLQRLIRASRVTDTGDGTAGESFLNNVTGSGTSVSMSNYIMTASSWSNTPSAPPTLYSNIHTFTDLTLTFDTFGSKASLIQAKGVGSPSWAVSYQSPFSTATATLNSISWASGVGTLNLTINGELTPGTPTTSVTAWYQGYTSPCVPFETNNTGGPGGCYVCTNTSNCGNCLNDCTTSYYVDFTFSAGAIAASGSSTNDLYLSYGPDRFASAFNSTVYGPGPTVMESWQILQSRRAGANPTIDAVQWATDSGFTNVVSTSTTYTISSDNNTDVSYYLRYKLDGAGSWTEWAGNPVQWIDHRNDT
jgi:hypothetical protein